MARKVAPIGAANTIEGSFIQSVEALEDELTQWALDYIETVTNAIMPDGRPFGFEPKTRQEQLQEYMQLRDNPESWTNWINERVARVVEMANGVPPEKIAPYDIVYRYALNWSAEMEDALVTERERAHAALSLPATIDVPETLGSELRISNEA